MKLTSTERFWSKVTMDDYFGCWTWTACKTWNGYGKFWDGKLLYAHRWSYENSTGPIPDGMQLDHACSNRACVNPHHLEPVTCRENLLRGDTRTAANASKTHCPTGHEYNQDNTYTYKGARQCRACWPAKNARYREKHATHRVQQ